MNLMRSNTKMCC